MVLLQDPVVHVGIRFGLHAGPAVAEVVGPVVENAPQSDDPLGLAGNAQEFIAEVLELRAGGRAAQAHVVEGQGPIGPLGAVLDSEQLVAGPVREKLLAENAVIPVLDAAEVERRIVEVRGEDRPIEDRNVFDVQQVVPRRDQFLVVDCLPVRLLGVRHRVPQPIDARGLAVFERGLGHLQTIAGKSQETGRDIRALGDEMVLVDLVQDVGVQADLAVEARREVSTSAPSTVPRWCRTS